MTKSKAYYQAFLVLECLSQEEYDLIPESLLNEIKSKMEPDPTMKIDPNLPLEKQKIDEKAYDILEKVIKSIEKNYGKDAIDNPNKYSEKTTHKEKSTTKQNISQQQSQKSKQKNESKQSNPSNQKNSFRNDNKQNDFQNKRSKELENENFKLQGIIKALEEENKKIEKAKELFSDYKEVLTIKDIKIKKLKDELEEARKQNEELYQSLNKIPKFIRKIFIKDYQKLLRAPSEEEGIVIKFNDGE